MTLTDALAVIGCTTLGYLLALALTALWARLRQYLPRPRHRAAISSRDAVLNAVFGPFDTP